MNKSFRTRKKKVCVPTVVGKIKTVRIDRKTLIQCSVSVSDEDARKRFYERHKIAIRPTYIGMPPMTEKEVFKEIPMGSVESLAVIIDDENLPDLE